MSLSELERAKRIYQCVRRMALYPQGMKAKVEYKGKKVVGVARKYEAEYMGENESK